MKKSKAKKTVSKRVRDKRKKFWAILGATVAVTLIVVVAIILAVGGGGQHDEVVAKYAEAWEEYADAQNDFGFTFGEMLGGMGFSTDDSATYQLSESDMNEMSKECAKTVGIYDEIYNNPYAVEDKEIAKKNTSEIQTAIYNLRDFAAIIRKKTESVENCREIGKRKMDQIDKRLAEEKAQADEEAAAKQKQEEARAAYNRNVLTYDKFNNQIKEGMSLAAVKDVYGSFDAQCKVASQSGGYVIYSCSPGSYSSDYWTASFTFYNGVLRSKAQYGLD